MTLRYQIPLVAGAAAVFPNSGQVMGDLELRRFTADDELSATFAKCG